MQLGLCVPWRRAGAHGGTGAKRQKIIYTAAPMTRPEPPSKLRTGRLGRFVQLGTMAGGLVGDVAMATGKMAVAASTNEGARHFHKAAAAERG